LNILAQFPHGVPDSLHARKLKARHLPNRAAEPLRFRRRLQQPINMIR
jgi:hypothetical protein